MGAVRGPVLVKWRSPAKSSRTAAKELFEEITETRALELEVVSFFTRSPFRGSASGLARRRRRTRARFLIGA